MYYNYIASATVNIHFREDWGIFAFDEDWYLRHNRDVAQAVERGFFASGLQHFLFFGFAEGRQPIPPIAADRDQGSQGNGSYQRASFQRVLELMDTGFP